ncbi:MAG: phosphatase PAP2 family protein [Aggregatilineales bacterium]
MKRHFVPDGLLSAALLFGLVLFLLSAGAFGVLTENVVSNEAIVHFDTAVDAAIHANTSPRLVQLMFVASVAGSQLLVVLTVMLVLLLVSRRRWDDLILLAVAVGGEEILNTVFKFSFHRLRPVFTDPLTTGLGYSFPSGHAMASMVFYGLIAYWLMRNSKVWAEYVLIALICLLIVAIIGFSRIYLGVHFPSDVLGGYIAGLAWLTFAISGVALVHRWRQKRHPPISSPP